MKRKVAVFGNGWSDEYIKCALDGIKKCAQENDIDLFFFIEYAAMGDTIEYSQGDINILNLPDFIRFDGFILLGNTLNNRGELDILRERIINLNKPVVCLEYIKEGLDCFCTDNYGGMHELCEHLVVEHNVRKVVFVSGDDFNTECKERRQALEDVLAEHGCPPLTDDSIFEGGWNYYSVCIDLPNWLETHELPDAFVCANDMMAIGVIYAMDSLGYSCPEDVIITGFDNIKAARTVNPMVTSVDRGWTQRSYDGMNHLIELMNGGKKLGVKKFPSRLSCGESCGCIASKELKKQQARLVNEMYSVPVHKTMFEWHLNALESTTNGIKEIDEIYDRMSTLFDNDSRVGYSEYEGDTFCICLDQSFLRSIFENTPGRCIGYGDRMDVIFAIRDGVPLARQTIDRSYIFPVFEKPNEGPNVYMIAPIHSSGTVIGYVAFKNMTHLTDDYWLNAWLVRVSKTMVRAKHCLQMELMNQKINEMSLKDELSGLYNRTGYEKRAIPFLEQVRSQGKTGILMVADINKMKEINDRFGHLQGDLAIRLVARSIMENIPDSWYAVRYGGDEFVVLGENIFLDEGQALQTKICSSLKRYAEDMMLPYDLTISVGTVVIDPNENLTLDQFFKKADSMMYAMKKRMHVQRE